MNENKRPVLVSIVCIIALLGAVASLVYFLRIIPPPALYTSILIVLVATVGVLGIWKMKKWGLYLYIITVVAGSIFGRMQLQTLIFPAILIVITLLNFRKLK